MGVLDVHDIGVFSSDCQMTQKDLPSSNIFLEDIFALGFDCLFLLLYNSPLVCCLLFF